MVAITAGLSAAGGTQWARWSGADVARVQGAPSSLVGECRTPAVSVAGTIIWGSCSWLDNMEGVDTPLGFRAGLWPQPDLAAFVLAWAQQTPRPGALFARDACPSRWLPVQVDLCRLVS